MKYTEGNLRTLGPVLLTRCLRPHRRLPSVVPFLCGLLLISALPAVAQERTIAVHPLMGRPQNVAETYFNDLVKEISNLPSYITYEIDPRHDVTDVNEGGWAAHICPQPVLTHGAPFAITGDMSQNPNRQNDYYVLLYLWNMTTKASKTIDMEFSDTDSISYSVHLAEIADWVQREISNWTQDEIINWTEIEIVRDSSDPEYWLYLGLRAGGGDAAWYYNYDRKKSVTNLLSANLSLQASGHLLSWLDIQAELNFCVDFTQPWDTSETGGSFVSAYFTIPLLFKMNWRKGGLMAGIFTGPYLYLPLFHTENKMGNLFNYKPNPPGIVFGVAIGWKMGIGSLFMDGRFEYDGLFWETPVPNQTYYRNMARLNIGYELSFFKK